MAHAKNKVQLIGRICVPTIKIAESGLKVAELCVYVNEAFFNNDGEKVNESMVHHCKAHGKLAETISEQFSKRGVFAIEGILVTSSYKPHGFTLSVNHVQISSFGVFKNYPHSQECRVFT